MPRSRRGGGEALNPWPGYVDALSTLLMVIIFVLLVFVLAYPRGMGMGDVKLAAVLGLLGLAFLWVDSTGVQRWSLFRQLGMTSLLVYWVHIEIVYGRWLGIWKEGLSVQQVLVFTALLIALMTALSLLRTRGRSIESWFKPAPVPEPRRASGD